MLAADKTRVGEAYADSHNMEGWLMGWENSLKVIIPLMEAKAKDAKTDATEKTANLGKRIPAAKKAQKDVQSAKTAVMGLMDELADSKLEGYGNAEEFLKLVGAGAMVLAAEALHSMKALDATMVVSGKKYLASEGRSRVLWICFPSYEKSLAQMTTAGAGLRTPLRPQGAAPAGKPGNAPSQKPAAPVANALPNAVRVPRSAPPAYDAKAGKAPAVGGKPVAPPKSAAATAAAKSAMAAKKP